MTPAERYARATERAAALQFLAQTFDGVDDDKAKKIRASVGQHLTDEVLGFSRADSVDTLYTDEAAWAAHMASLHGRDAGESYRPPTQGELEGLTDTLRASQIHGFSFTTEHNSLAKTQVELERRGRAPKFETPAWLKDSQ